MTDIQKVICITCPKGCTLDVSREGNAITKIEGGCKRGHDYVLGELTDPRRMVASTVKIEGSIHPLVPVYTASPFPKGEISALLAELRKVELHAPVKMNDIVLENVLGSGINILASRNMDKIIT